MGFVLSLLFSENPLDCDFESNTFCNWEVKEGYTNQWDTHTGTTSTQDTGPSQDHTESKNGAGKCVLNILLPLSS